MSKSTIAPLFFGAIFSIAGAIIAGGLVEEWWAFAILVPTGSIAGKLENGSNVSEDQLKFLTLLRRHSTAQKKLYRYHLKELFQCEWHLN